MDGGGEQEKESTKEREYLEYFTTFSTLIIKM